MAEEPGSYRVPVAETSGELREQGSRFLAFLAPAGDEEDARRCVEELARRHHDATHVCFAWRLGWPPRERASDAGEPRGTAGPPILAALAGAELSDTVLAVVRWFGGTKLGKGGLVRAYGGAARTVIAAAATRRLRPAGDWSLEFDYPQLGAVQRLIDPPRVALLAGDYGARVHLRLRVECAAAGAWREALADLGLRPEPLPADDT